MNRIWDPEGKYKEGFLKEYDNWVLEVSFRQHTLGCFIIFAKRKVERISELTIEEFAELKEVMLEIENALSSIETFKPKRFNYLQLGNGLHRLHFHGIPRYESERQFNNITWEDKAWGHPPIWSKTEISAELIVAIKQEILKHLSK